MLKGESFPQSNLSSQGEWNRTTIDWTVSYNESYVCFALIFQVDISESQSMLFFTQQKKLRGKNPSLTHILLCYGSINMQLGAFS